MKPHVLLIEPMMPEAEAQLDAAYLPAPPVCGTRPRGAGRRNRLLGARHGFTAVPTSEPQAPPRKSFVHC